MDGSDSAKSLLGKKFAATRSAWFADVADLFILLCSFLLMTASIVLVALVFHTQATSGDPDRVMLILQRAISALSTTTTSALIMVVGKRYVLYKLARGGMRSRRVALYSCPSVGSLTHHLVRRGVELPLLVLLTAWALGLATGLTANDAWAMVPTALYTPMAALFGPLDAAVPPGSLLIPAFAQLSYVMASECLLGDNPIGALNIIGGMPDLTSGGPAGLLVYPPLSDYIPDSTFSVSTGLNGFNVSMETLSSLPPTAQNLTCVDSIGSGFSTGQLWYGGGDNRTLSIIAILPGWSGLYRFNASAIIIGGLLTSTGSKMEFMPNGTTSPNVMSSDQWAQDIAALVCNATCPIVGQCNLDGVGSSLLDFSIAFNLVPTDIDGPTLAGVYWSTALGMAMGAYSAAALSSNSLAVEVSVTVSDAQFSSYYGIYVLIANIVVSALMLVVATRLRMTSHLGGDFMDATRLLLDALRNPELFNASLDTTVNALGNPKMLVREDSELFFADQAPSEDGQSTIPETL